jgi:lysozyme family protein
MKFEKAFEIVIGHEGGYVNDPLDKGGETKYGISKRAYPNLDIKNLTLADAQRIYKADYWDKAKSEDVPEFIRYIHFDAAVNHGVGMAVKLLQRAANVKDDGIFGPITKNAAQWVTVEAYALQRMFLYNSIIGRNNNQVRFINGWTNRIISIVKDSK